MAASKPHGTSFGALQVRSVVRARTCRYPACCGLLTRRPLFPRAVEEAEQRYNLVMEVFESEAASYMAEANEARADIAKANPTLDAVSAWVPPHGSACVSVRH